ncbi:tRNA pseudouridine(13) synthase TruD [Halobellus salinus]|uniref:Probable tRNA pseudouridine synthase D n=1 Tax=Halobellus salinus TaxID=931585 RepID=A0A830EQ90_9EURY|nr:tRNA pseudouridine(13) synthase TruD [Halobellus salinus]GGI99604.1 tRNA pseudouridine(13) synthase TruD [Halobellus salinus]SMP02629.1 tRNA pseudouridine13 synthase [Halobellus salinus]
MREAHPAERRVGIEYYRSDAAGTGGRLRTRPEDFRVRELETTSPAPLDADTGDYPHLLVRATLRKWDTNDFANRVSNALGISRERVSWAGTKDKHAVTTQLFTLANVAPDDVPAVAAADIELVGRVGRALYFGDLAGNAFEIRVRDATPETVDEVTAALRVGTGDESHDDPADVAVPNYFGHQRFGSRRPVTHKVGLCLTRGEWREAVLAYAGTPADAEPEATRDARTFVDQQAETDDPDWAAAVERMPGALRFERSMLHRLNEDGDATPEAWRHALEAVPTNLQRLFVNAAQSYAFNRIVSERLRRGLPIARPVEGDVVCFADGDAPADLSRPDTDRTQVATGRRVDVMTRHCDRGRAFVTAPLVGVDTEFAAGEPGEIERSVLDDLGLAPADFDLPGAFHSTGTRRAVLLRTRVGVETDPAGDAYDLSFSLPSGSYATVLLREYLKVPPTEL